MEIRGKTTLVLGGYGLVGMAVCRELLGQAPARLVVGSLRREQSERAIEELRREPNGSRVELVPAWGDILLRAEWQTEDSEVHPRVAILRDTDRRRRLAADILDEMDEEILTASLLYQLITGQANGLGGIPADIVVDCVNTATAVAYQNIFENAHRLQDRILQGEETDWPQEVERLLTSLYVPQLVRHMQILYDAMLRAGTQAYVKVGTSGTGGMGFNIPYTHGEERPSRVLLAKSAVAGAQTMLLFLLALTPHGPKVVKEIKPTAGIAWKEIAHGPIRTGGHDFPLYDCSPSEAVRLADPASLLPNGDFGAPTGEVLESVFIDTGENGLFSVGEFTAITTLGQMMFVTPEEIAQNVVSEIVGRNTGRDVIGALDASVMGPSYRGGFMRQTALNRLHQLEAEHDVDSVAFELLGPPRLSKLLFEAYLFKRACEGISEAIRRDSADLSQAFAALIEQDGRLRRHILSIGIPILLPDGEHLLRGPVLKSPDAENGWVDLTPANVARWQARLKRLQEDLEASQTAGSGSRVERSYPSLRRWVADDSFDVGEIVGWLFNTEEQGRRGKI